MTLDEALKEIVSEYEQASLHNPPFNSAHEGFAVILEECDELKAEVWKSQLERDIDAQVQEAGQIGANGPPLLIDLC